jgi:hypothetical protein
MRSPEQIAQIRQHITDPYHLQHFLQKEEVDELVEMFEKGIEKIHKNTGPITLNLDLTNPLIQRILERATRQIGLFDVTAAFFFYTTTPHIIHNDDTFELPDTVYRAITLPLRLEDFKGAYPKLCFFDQFYFHGPAKFFNKSTDIPTYYNKQVYEYSEVDGTTDKPFTQHHLVPHLRKEWLEGLSLHSALPWVPQNAIIFDSVRLHCASDFRRLGIKSKLGISIFTKRQ